MPTTFTTPGRMASAPVRALCSRQHRFRFVAQAEAGEGHQVTVQFNMRRKLKYGMQACIIGSPGGMGSWKKTEASPMTWSDGDVWQASMPLTPGEEVEYKYLIRGDDGSIHEWQKGGNRRLSVDASAVSMSVTDGWEARAERDIMVDHSHSTSGPAAAAQTPESGTKEAQVVTVMFELARELKFGQELVMVGSSAPMGAWDLKNAVRMKWTEGHVWQAELSLMSTDLPVEYKYVAIGGGSKPTAEWEKGANHILAVEDGSTALAVTDAWGQEGRQPPAVTTAQEGEVEEVQQQEEKEDEIRMTFERLEIITPSGRLVPKMTVRELKDECKELGINSCGRKTELRVRLTEYLESSPSEQEGTAAPVAV